MKERNKLLLIIGIFLAIIAGIIPSIANFPYLLLVLVALGLIVGFLNIAQKNVTTLLHLNVRYPQPSSLL